MRADEAFLRQLLGGIVLQLEHMRFDRTEDERGILFRIHLAKADMPLVIGKAGQSIKALRLVMKMHAKDGPAYEKICLKRAHCFCRHLGAGANDHRSRGILRSPRPGDEEVQDRGPEADYHDHHCR